VDPVPQSLLEPHARTVLTAPRSASRSTSEMVSCVLVAVDTLVHEANAARIGAAAM